MGLYGSEPRVPPALALWSLRTTLGEAAGGRRVQAWPACHTAAGRRVPDAECPARPRRRRAGPGPGRVARLGWGASACPRGGGGGEGAQGSPWPAHRAARWSAPAGPPLHRPQRCGTVAGRLGRPCALVCAGASPPGAAPAAGEAPRRGEPRGARPAHPSTSMPASASLPSPAAPSPARREPGRRGFPPRSLAPA